MTWPPVLLTIAVVAVMAPTSSSAQSSAPLAPSPAPPGQPTPSPTGRGADGPLAPLEVQVTITRLLGQKVISVLPHVLAVTANSGSDAQVNMGAEVPLLAASAAAARTTPAEPAPRPSSTQPSDSPGAAPPPARFSYRQFGTVIACRAIGGDDGRYLVVLSIDDTSVYSSDLLPQGPALAATAPVFRSFKARNTLLLQDGQTRQYTAASDHLTGEVIRVDVTMRVLK